MSILFVRIYNDCFIWRHDYDYEETNDRFGNGIHIVMVLRLEIEAEHRKKKIFLFFLVRKV